MLGQWLRGRIYERRCDLSPSGKHFIYFAMNGKWKSTSKGSWTAISRAPFIHAIGFWPKGDCWNGGGLFVSEREYWLNDDGSHEMEVDPRPLLQVGPLEQAGEFGGECPGVYYPRLLRDGWQLVDRIKQSKRHQVDIFEKHLRSGWILRKLAHGTLDHPPGRGCYYDEHDLVRAKTNDLVAVHDWEWADVDGNRLVWASKGCLYAGRLTKAGLGGVKQLVDMNSQLFAPIRAPYDLRDRRRS